MSRWTLNDRNREYRKRADWKRAAEIQSLAVDNLILWYPKNTLMKLSRNN